MRLPDQIIADLTEVREKRAALDNKFKMLVEELSQIRDATVAALEEHFPKV